MKIVPTYSNFIIAIFLFVLAFWGIHYTADWEGYTYAFYNTDMARDRAFSFLAEFFYEKGLNYRDLFHFHIVLMGVLFSIFYYKLKANPILFVALTLFVGYVGIGNQIRYYVAFPLVLMACLYWFKKKRMMSIICFLIALYFHYTIIIVYFLFIFMDLVINRAEKRKWQIIVLMNLFIFFLVYKSNFMMEEQYSAYKNLDKTSSFAGGLFNLTPLIISIYYLKNISLREVQLFNTEAEFLYILLISSLPLFFLSIYMQITGSRMLMALLPCYMCFFVKARRCINDIHTRKMCTRAISLTLVYFVFWRFFIPLLCGVNGAMITELRMMVESYYLW